MYVSMRYLLILVSSSEHTPGADKSSSWVKVLKGKELGESALVFAFYVHFIK